MKGQFFVSIANTPQGLNVRTGVVKEDLGNSRWLLEFKGLKYTFSTVFNSEQLELQGFVFFGTEEAQQAFLQDLSSQQQPLEQQPLENALTP